MLFYFDLNQLSGVSFISFSTRDPFIVIDWPVTESNPEAETSAAYDPVASAGRDVGKYA